MSEKIPVAEVQRKLEAFALLYAWSDGLIKETVAVLAAQQREIEVLDGSLHLLLDESDERGLLVARLRRTLREIRVRVEDESSPMETCVAIAEMLDGLVKEGVIAGHEDDD